MDLTHHGNEIIAKQFNIDGYPTLEYFEGGMHKFRYKGQNSKVSARNLSLKFFNFDINNLANTWDV